MKRLLIAILLLCSSAYAGGGVEYQLDDSANTNAQTYGHQSYKIAQGASGHVWVLSDHSSGTNSLRVFATTNWGTAWTYIANVFNGINGDLSANIFALGDTAYAVAGVSTSGAPVVAAKIVGTNKIATDTIGLSAGNSPNRLAGLLWLGGKYAAFIDHDSTTDYTSIKISNDTLISSMTWTQKFATTILANAGLGIPIYDASGIAKCFMKINMNTEQMYILDTINGVTLAFDSITQTTHGSAATDLQTPSYGAYWATHLAGDYWIAGWQRAVTGTKGLVVRPFKLGWSGTTPVEGTWLADQQEIVSSANSPDGWRFNPTFGAVAGKADSIWLYYRAQDAGTDSVDIMVAFSSDTGKTWGAAAELIDGADTLREYLNLQAAPDFRSAAGVVYRSIIYEDSSSAAASSYAYAYLDTLYNPVASATDVERILINAKGGPAAINRKEGPNVVNKK